MLMIYNDTIANPISYHTDRFVFIQPEFKPVEILFKLSRITSKDIDEQVLVTAYAMLINKPKEEDMEYYIDAIILVDEGFVITKIPNNLLSRDIK